MDTVVALLSAVARALRGLFDMALMAVGVAPTSVPVTDAAVLPMSDEAEGAAQPQSTSQRDLGLDRSLVPLFSEPFTADIGNE